MWMICKKEWQQFFSSVTGFMVPAIFLLLTGLLLFVLPDTSILEFGYAQLDQFFSFMPWLLVFLIPAIAMRSIADEAKQGTLETLFTLPISKTAVILGKYFGVLGISIFTLLPTIIYPFSLQALSITGGIDIGATIGSYCSLFLLAAVYAAIALVATASTKNSMAAFVLGAFGCLTMHSGFNAISKLPVFADGADYYIQLLGIQYHVANMSRGVLSAADIIYFLALIACSIYITISKFQATRLRIWPAIAIALAAIAWGSNYIRYNIDLTQEKRFTLSKSTVQLLENIDSTIRVEVFLAGKLPADYKKLSLATENILAAFNTHTAIQVEFKELGAAITDDSLKAQLFDSLARLGVVFERNIAQEDAGNKTVSQLIVPAALVYYRPDQLPVAVDLRSSKKVYKQFNIITEEPQEDVEATRNAAEALLENKFAVAINKLTRKNIPTVAYVVGNGQPIDLSVNDLGQSLRNDYRLGVFDLKRGYPDANQIQTLIIVKPTIPFSDEDLLKLDQYVMQGGSIFWCIDKLYAELDSLKRTNAQYTAFDRGLGIDEILFKYGVRINGDLLQDLHCSKIPLVVGKNPDGSIRMQRMPWPYYPFLSARTPNPISQNIDRVLPLFPSSIDTVAAPGIQKTILLATDSNSRSIASPAIVSLNSVQSEADLLQFNKSYVPVAVMLEGKFNSLFSNRLSKAALDTLQSKTSKTFFAKATKASKQIVIADADIVTNQISNTTGPLPMGTIPLEDYRFGNREFFLNSIDYLSTATNLFESRNKTVVLRLLDKQKLSTQKIYWQLLNTLLPVLLVIVWGWIFQEYRKKIFAIH
jgi:ABC-2 type transport system permease protein